MIEYNSSIKAFIESSSNRIQVEIGDAKQVDAFYPRVKLKAWDNECNVSFGLDIGEQEAVIESMGDVIKWRTPKAEAHFYNKPIDEINEQGAYEFEVILNEKPNSNVIPLTLNVPKNVEFYYQGPLTAEEIAEGHFRPENVIDSWAVYHSSKSHNDYKTGKVFHIYRPEAIDADGNKIWCRLDIDVSSQKAAIIIPQEFLDTAIYPVIIDPTFGYTSVGASSISWYYPCGCKFTAPEGGTMNSISWYGRGANSADELGLSLYSSTFNQLALHSGNNIVPGTTAKWSTEEISHIIESGVDYWLCWWCSKVGGSSSDKGYFYYDTGLSGQTLRDVNLLFYDFENWPATISPSYFSYKVSIYATYETSGGGTTHNAVASVSTDSLANATGTTQPQNVIVGAANVGADSTTTAKGFLQKIGEASTKGLGTVLATGRRVVNGIIQMATQTVATITGRVVTKDQADTKATSTSDGGAQMILQASSEIQVESYTHLLTEGSEESPQSVNSRLFKSFKV